MKNRIAGILIIGIAVMMAFIVFSFNKALTEIVSLACVHGPACPMWGTLEAQTNVSIGIIVFVILIGFYLIFFGKEEKIVKKIVRQQIKPKEISKRNYMKVLRTLKGDERRIFELVIKSKGSVLQSEIVETTGLSKVRVSRLLDQLEGRGLVERKRRGMSNVVVLKHSELF